MQKPKPKFDHSWTLFLDRDGVINERLPSNYVKRWEEFTFMEKVPESIAAFSSLFGIIVIVTNQQGIGKKLMTDEDLIAVHNRMKQEVEIAGGRIDGIYYCPDLAKLDTPTRKPNPGMAYLAQKDFPQIDFEKSVMVGDSYTDMLFGHKLGMKKVFIETKKEEFRKVRKAAEWAEPMLLDYRFPLLKDFAAFLFDREM